MPFPGFIALPATQAAIVGMPWASRHLVEGLWLRSKVQCKQGPFYVHARHGKRNCQRKELGELNCTAVQYDAVLCEACHGCRSCVHGHHRGPRNVAAFTSNSAPASLCWRNTYRSSTLCSWIMGASDGAGPVPTTNQVRLVPRATANGAPSGPLAGGATSDEEGESKRDDNGTY